MSRKNIDIYGSDKLKKDLANVNKLQEALSKSFNNSLGIFDTKKFYGSLGNSTSLKEIQTTMSKTAEGQMAFNDIVGSVYKMNTGFKSISSFTDKIMNTFGNTVRWGITASIFQTIQNSLYRSVDYVKELDTSLNNIRIVTDATNQDMREFSQNANKIASSLGASTVAFTDAAQLYAQNGYSEEDYTKLAELTTKVANVTQQSTSDVSEQITSLMAGYKMSIDEAEDSLSGMAVVAAASASDLGELAKAEQQVASAANTLGVSQDQLTAQLSTIISVTRESPESVGNSLKTIYARLGDLQLGDTLDDGTTLGDVSGTLEKIGVSVMDVNGDMRQMGDILEDLMAKWQDLTTAQKQAAAVKLAGKYQYNNLMTLMSNSDMYYQQKEMAGNSQGALDEQQAIYMDSLQAKLQKLSTTWEGFVTELVDSNNFKGAIDGLSDIIDGATKLTDTLGGLTPVLTLVGSLMVKSFGKNMAAGVTNAVQNMAREQIHINNEAILRQKGALSPNGGTAAEFLAGTINSRSALTEEQQKNYDKILAEKIAADNKLIESNQRLQEATEAFREKLQDQNDELQLFDLNADKVVSDLAGAEAKIRQASDSYQSEIYKLEAKRTPFGNLSGEIKTNLDNLDSKELSATAAANNIKDYLEKNLTEIPDEYQQIFQPYIQKLGNLTENNKQAFGNIIKQMEDDINSVNEELDNAIKANEVAKQQVTDIEKRLSKNSQDFKASSEFNNSAKWDVENQNEANYTQIQETNMQSYLNSVMQVTAAIGQLAFAWQGFTSLGSLWSQDDIDTGEKLVQTIQVMTFTLPSLVEGVVSFANNLQSAKDALQKIKAAQLEEIAAGGTAAIYGLSESTSLLGVAFDLVKTKILKAAEAIKSFIVANASLSAGIGLLVVAVTALSAAFASQQQAIENAKESEARILSDAQSQASTVKTSVDNWEELYQQYKKTGEASEEFLSSSKEVASSLEIEGANALVAAQNYEELAKRIQEKNDAEQQSVIDAAKNANSGGLRQSLNGGALGLGSTGHGAAVNARSSVAGLLSGTNSYNGFMSATSGVIQGSSFETDISQMEQARKFLQDELEKLGKTYDEAVKNGFEGTAQEYEQQAEKLQDGITKINADFFEKEDIKTYLSNIETAAEARVQQYSFQSSLSQAGTNVDKIKDFFTTDDSVGPYLQTVSDYAQQLQFMISSVQDEAQKAALEAEQASYKAAQMAKSFTGSDETADKVYSSIKNSGLTNSQIVTFVGTLDKDTTWDNFSQVIQDFKDSPESLISFTPTIDTSKLESAMDSKSALSSLASSYNSNGVLYEDEVASAAKEDPEILQYLTKIGDAYYLNTEAADEWNKAIEKQTEELENLQGSFNGAFFDEWQQKMQNSADMLQKMAQAAQTDVLNGDLSENEANALSGLTNITNSVLQASQSLEDGEISVMDYFDSYSQAFDDNDVADIFANISSYSEATQRSLLDLAELLEGGLADGVNQATKQLKNGQMTITDYNKVLVSSAKSGLTMQASLQGLVKDGDKWIQSLDEEGDGVENLSQQQQDWISNTKSAFDDLDMAEKASSMNEALTATGEYLKEITDGYGNLTVDWDSIVNTEQFSQTASSLATGISDFIGGSQQNLELFASALGMTSQDLVNTIGTDSSSIASWLASNQGNFESGTQAMMSTSASAVGVIGSSVSGIISDLASMIDSFEAEITATPTLTWTNDVREFEILGQKFSIGFPMPHFNVKVSGQATGNTAKTLGSLKSNLQNLSGGISNLTAVGGAMNDISIDDWIPKGNNAADPNSFANPGVKSGSGSGKKGSGGSGSGKTYEPKTKDKDDSDLDRYEKVNAHLDKIAATLEKLQAAQDRLTGKKLTENLAQQVKLLQEQTEWEQQKLEIEKQEAAEYANILKSQYGIGIDSQGFLTNYADVYNQLYNEYSNIVDKYNATTDEAGQEALETQVENAKKRLDSFSDYVSKYDELLTSTITDSEKKIQDYYDKIEDIRIEAFKKSVDAANNIKEIQEKLIDFNAVFRSIKNYNEADEPFNDIITNTEKLSKYWDVNTKSMNEYYDELIKNNKEALSQSGLSQEKKNWLLSRNDMYTTAKNQLGKGTLEAGGSGYMDIIKMNVNDILEQMRQFESTGTSTIFGENSAELYEVAKTVLDNATQMVSDYKDSLDDLKSNVLDGIDEIGNAIDDVADRFDNINDTLSTYADMITLVSGDKAYSKLNEMYAAQVKNNEAEIDMLKESISQLQELQKTFEEGSDQWNAVADQITDKQNKLLDKTKDTMDAMNSIYSNNVNSALDKWLEGTPLGSDLDWMSDQWELINRNEDQYLDKTNSAYNIQKLQAKYIDLLDQSDNLLTQQKITDQMNQQLALLRSKDKLSQYDVDYANAQLEILQKTIALQDAQNNKSQMKLKRDAQGNYSYVYGANEGDVKSAQSDLLDAQNNAYNLSKDQIKQVQDDSLSALQDAKSMLADIWTNANLTLEEKTKRTQTIIDSLKEYLAGTADQLSTAEQNIIQDFIGMCEMMTDENKSGLQDTYDQLIAGNDAAFSTIDSRWGDTISKWLGSLDSFNTATDGMFKSLVDSAGTYQDGLEGLGKKAGLEFGNMTTAIDATKKSTDELTSSLGAFYDKLKSMSGEVQTAEAALQKYRSDITDLTNGMGALQGQVNELGDKLSAKERENADLSDQLAEMEAKLKAAESAASSSGNGGWSSGDADRDLTAKRIANSIWEYGDWGTGSTRRQRISERYGDDMYNLVQSYFNGNPAYGYDYKDYSLGFERFDTGGYTGTWAANEGVSDVKNGKWAILHQKELVLNESDTANILEAVKNVRQMADAISSNGILSGMNGIQELIGNSIKAISDSLGSMNVEQNVNIDANFPNVSDYLEIEKAFNDLGNAAIQYAARSNRFGQS